MWLLYRFCHLPADSVHGLLTSTIVCCAHTAGTSSHKKGRRVIGAITVICTALARVFRLPMRLPVMQIDTGPHTAKLTSISWGNSGRA